MWDERFSEPGYAYGTEPNDYLAAVASHIQQGPVLCIAEGQGRNAVALAQLGHVVHAIDSSAVGLQKAKALADSKGVALLTEVVDLADYDFGIERWGAVVSIFCHLPPQLRRRCHAQIVRSLKPGGWFVAETYRPEQLECKTGGPQQIELLVTVEDLRHELAGLTFVELRSVNREIHEGAYHNGPSAVVQCLAQKPLA